MSYFPPIPKSLGDYPLDHLDPIDFEVWSEKVGRQLRVRCRFSNHVYTVFLEKSPVVSPNAFPDILHQVDERYFSRVRWSWSKNLPAIIAGMAKNEPWVRETSSRRNWMYPISVGLNHSDEEAYGPYLLFFSLKSGRRRHNYGTDLEMFVESAYRRDKDNPYPPLLGRAKFRAC